MNRPSQQMSALAIPSHEEMVARAAAMIPALRERSRHCEELRRIPQETIDEFRAAGLFRIFQPRRFEGYGLGLDTVIEVTMQIGRGCGSSAWMAGQWPGHQFMVGQFPLEAQEEYWATGPDTMSSTASAVAKLDIQPERGGWRIRDTQMRFSSGCDAAAWILFTTKHGIGLVPKSDFTILDDWHVAGLRGTGSKSIVIKDAFIPPHRCITNEDMRDGKTPGAALHPDNPYYRVPLSLVTNHLLLAAAAGMAHGIVDLFEQRVTKRFDLHSGKPASEGAGAQLRFAESAAEIDAATMFLRRNCQRAADWGRANYSPTELERAQARRDCGFAAKLCVTASDRLLASGDASGMFDNQPIGRLGRDLRMACLQASLTWDAPALTYSRTRWGLPPLERSTDVLFSSTKRV